MVHFRNTSPFTCKILGLISHTICSSLQYFSCMHFVLPKKRRVACTSFSLFSLIIMCVCGLLFLTNPIRNYPQSIEQFGIRTCHSPPPQSLICGWATAVQICQRLHFSFQYCTMSTLAKFYKMKWKKCIVKRQLRGREGIMQWPSNENWTSLNDCFYFLCLDLPKKWSLQTFLYL